MEILKKNERSTILFYIYKYDTFQCDGFFIKFSLILDPFDFGVIPYLVCFAKINPHKNSQKKFVKINPHKIFTFWVYPQVTVENIILKYN